MGHSRATRLLKRKWGIDSAVETDETSNSTSKFFARFGGPRRPILSKRVGFLRLHVYLLWSRDAVFRWMDGCDSGERHFSGRGSGLWHLAWELCPRSLLTLEPSRQVFAADDLALRTFDWQGLEF